MKKDGIRTRNLYDPQSAEPYRLSRSKIELFLKCPRCFYLDRRLGINRPDGPPFTLNSAVDTLLKKEFDLHRAKGQAHPLMTAYGIDAVPFIHPDLAVWRDNFKGIEHHHAETGFVVTGAIDDVWKTKGDELIVVDYKATSTQKEISLEDDWRQSYKRQLEIYQWLMRKNGYKVSDTGYFVYVNASKDKEAFDRTLEFSVQLLPYRGTSAWVDEALQEIHLCLHRTSPPPAHPECEWCAYTMAVSKVG
ncbi:PD-(D/E)XK nuclease family protein [Candidatus Peregrinibacteria bacterium]|nr:PD-(D/E)XK nuclease family protein [Candidatus Peregrinibacteria bacterium]